MLWSLFYSWLHVHMSTDKLPGRGNSTAQTQDVSFFPVQFAPQIAAPQSSVSPLTQAGGLQDNALSQQTAMNMALNYHLPHWEYCCPYGQTFNPEFLNSDSELQAAMEITEKKKKKKPADVTCHASLGEPESQEKQAKCLCLDLELFSVCKRLWCVTLSLNDLYKCEIY